MSTFNRFMKQNKIQKENTTYAATKSLLDEEGKALMWKIKPLNTVQNDAIREDCTVDVPVKGKPNLYRPKVNTSLYMARMICAAVVEPNLYDKELQDSYAVSSPEALLKEMVDDPGEYGAFAEFIQRVSGFSDIAEDIEKAKN